MKDLVKQIVKSILDEKSKIEVNEILGDTSSIIEVIVDSEDLGKVIGKQGKTASHIRGIVYASAWKTGKRYTVDIRER